MASFQGREFLPEEAAQPMPPAPELRAGPELDKYLNRIRLWGEPRQQCLAMMLIVGTAGFEVSLLSGIVWWMVYDSPKGERVFADVFQTPGFCVLLWKDKGSAETEQELLHELDLRGIEGFFPFAPKELIDA